MKQVLCWCKPIPTLLFSYMAALAMTHYERERCDCFPERLGFRLRWTAYELILPNCDVYQTLFKFLQSFYLSKLQETFLFVLDYHLLSGVRLRLINFVTLSVI